jgi:hypothetical protein
MLALSVPITALTPETENKNEGKIDLPKNIKKTAVKLAGTALSAVLGTRADPLLCRAWDWLISQFSSDWLTAGRMCCAMVAWCIALWLRPRWCELALKWTLKGIAATGTV